MAEEVGKMLVWFVKLQLKGYEGTSILGGGYFVFYFWMKCTDGII